MLLKDVDNVGGGVLLCTRVILRFVMAKNEVVFESVGQVNETIAHNMNIVHFHNLSDVENVHQQCDNDVSNEMNL